jgi:hypothetical protein
MIRYYVTGILLIGLAAFFGCTKGEEIESPFATPESTMDTYIQAMHDGDFEKAFECYSENSTKSVADDIGGLKEDEIKIWFIKSLSDNQEPYVKANPENLSVKMLTAEATYELDGVPYTQFLINENGEWKITTNLGD